MWEVPAAATLKTAQLTCHLSRSFTGSDEARCRKLRRPSLLFLFTCSVTEPEKRVLTHNTSGMPAKRQRESNSHCTVRT